MRQLAVLGLGLTCCGILCAQTRASNPWTLVQDAHFEIYSQAGPANGRSALRWFDQLRAFFEQMGLVTSGRIRVIGFRSVTDYQPYRLRPIADAYYVGTDSRDYIVMPSLGPDRFAMAAHEYAHAVLRASGASLPRWLNEGLAEFFSTARIGERDCELGGDFRMRSQTLLHHAWMPLLELFEWKPDSAVRETRDEAGTYYAQSWALTQMLVLSPEYARGFPALVQAIHAGSSSAQALEKTYGKSLHAITQELHASVENRKFPAVTLSGVAPSASGATVARVSAIGMEEVMADLLFASGDLERAAHTYRDLSQQEPENPDTSAALGEIALRRGDSDTARSYWRQAIRNGVRDANVCYRYAALAEQAGLGAGEIRPALERAIALNPAFDDARYNLALLDSNAGDYAGAIANLHAMHTVAPSRAYGYWSALAYALTESNQRGQAQAAADKAMQYARTADERSHVSELKYIAQTDLTVQMTHDANGQTRMMMTRVPHGTTGWNPFVEPGDRMASVQGQLKQIGCNAGHVTELTVQTSDAILKLAIPDPSRVLMRNAPSQFTCGEQAPRTVVIHYARAEKPGPQLDGVLRGMDFH